MANAAVWSKRVAAWRASGRSAAEFSAGKGYAPATLKWWASRLSRSAEVAAIPAATRIARVVRAAAPAPTSASGAVVVDLGAARVTIEHGVDRATLELVLDVLRAQSGRAR